jgi:hypothetical protein
MDWMVAWVENRHAPDFVVQSTVPWGGGQRAAALCLSPKSCLHGSWGREKRSD